PARGRIARPESRRAPIVRAPLAPGRPGIPFVSANENAAERWRGFSLRSIPGGRRRGRKLEPPSDACARRSTPCRRAVGAPEDLVLAGAEGRARAPRYRARQRARKANSG